MKASHGLFYWLPRILSILAILFISMFALDSFAPELTIWEQIGGFLIHLIPSFILLIFLVIAWKWELIGGIIFIIVGLLMTPLIYEKNFHMNHSVWISLEVVLMITIPFIVIGVLFVLHHYLRGKGKKI